MRRSRPNAAFMKSHEGSKGSFIPKHKDSKDLEPERPELSTGARELKLFGENDSQLYHSRHTPILKNLTRKKEKGVYDHEKAVKLFRYEADDAAKRYRAEHGGSFSVAERNEYAREAAKEFEREYEMGEYSHHHTKGFATKLEHGKRVEEEEHPHLTGTEAENIARDHLVKNPNYYSKKDPPQSPSSFSPAQEAKVERVLHEYKEGELRSSSGEKVTKRKQAVAIALSEARREKKQRMKEPSDYDRPDPKKDTLKAKIERGEMDVFTDKDVIRESKKPSEREHYDEKAKWTFTNKQKKAYDEYKKEGISNKVAFELAEDKQRLANTKHPTQEEYFDTQERYSKQPSERAPITTAESYRGIDIVVKKKEDGWSRVFLDDNYSFDVEPGKNPILAAKKKNQPKPTYRERAK